jgi:hypothetical protein
MCIVKCPMDKCKWNLNGECDSTIIDMGCGNFGEFSNPECRDFKQI